MGPSSSIPIELVILLVIYGPLIIVCIVVFYFAKRSLKNTGSARAERGQCPHCGYDLTGVRDSNQCPECGFQICDTMRWDCQVR